MSQNGNGNNKSSNAINWATVVLVAVTGGGNFLETRAGNDLSASEIKRATQEIHDLYPRLEEAIRRQKELYDILQTMQKQRGS